MYIYIYVGLLELDEQNYQKAVYLFEAAIEINNKQGKRICTCMSIHSNAYTCLYLYIYEASYLSKATRDWNQ
jgi:hypothetical protein